MNRKRLADIIANNPEAMRWLSPSAGYTAFIQLPFRAEPFCRSLAEKHRVLLLPGSVYGTAYERFMRIGFGCSTERFAAGIATVQHELQNWIEPAISQ